ncbi:winged helix-turn-helix domain-containing protein [Actinoplanes sp. NBC_00393]|uniref:AfsR/SARP family transcriptional regulator n=1 Tax=Actinoplanes sp. NBC_00393 TaxID=2975953 RepID=UPI002E21E73C
MTEQRPLLMARFLGGFRVTVDDVAVDTGPRRRARQMLAYLLANRRAPVPRDVLADTFWPDAEPEAARNNLHVTLSYIRRALRAAHPGVAVERRFEAYRIAGTATIWTDVEQFARHRSDGAQADRHGDRSAAMRDYEAACQLYDGDFLADDPYAEWAVPVREAVRLDVIDVHARLVEWYVEQRALGPATMLARRLLEIDPCNEAAHQRLMWCYAATGQRHLALSQYHRLVELLWKSLRVPPSARTTELFRELCHPRPERGTRLAS